MPYKYFSLKHSLKDDLRWLDRYSPRDKANLSRVWIVDFQHVKTMYANGDLETDINFVGYKYQSVVAFVLDSIGKIKADLKIDN